MKRKKTAKPALQETEVAEQLIRAWEPLGYECYKEVINTQGGSNRNDCFFVRRENGVVTETVAVETKTSFTLKVIEQAWEWKNYAHKSFVGVPANVGATRAFTLALCKEMGIGVVAITAQGAKILLDAPVNPRPKLPTLYEQQKQSAAGNAESQYYTAFKHTCGLLNAFMEAHDPQQNGIALNVVIKAIDHHYASD